MATLDKIEVHVSRLNDSQLAFRLDTMAFSNIVYSSGYCKALLKESAKRLRIKS